MIKERIQKEQPIVYQTLKNSLENHRLSHALLFTGPKGTPKLQTAILLAQSLVCEKHQGFACECCDTCKRVADGNFVDMIVLDGSEKSIKKEEILSIQAEFNKTALESDGHKIYIINRVENATDSALNTLLKFLEEPSGSNTTAILIVEELSRLLPTIVSRCQIIPFRPLSQEDCCKVAIELGADKEDSFILSHFINDAQEILEVTEKESYQKALAGVRYFMSHVLNLDEVLVWLQTDVFNNKDLLKETFVYFVDILDAILQDAAKGVKSEIVWYNQEIEKINELNIDVGAWLLILLSAKDKSSRPYNMGLLLDQMILDLKKSL